MQKINSKLFQVVKRVTEPNLIKYIMKYHIDSSTPDFPIYSKRIRHQRFPKRDASDAFSSLINFHI